MMEADARRLKLIEYRSEFAVTCPPGHNDIVFLLRLYREANAESQRLSTALLNPSEEVREAVGRAVAETLSDIQLGSTIQWEDLVFRRDAMKIADAAITATAQKITREV